MRLANVTKKIHNATKRIHKARAVFEIVRKRIAYRGPRNELIETSVVDSILRIPKKMQKTFFACVAEGSYDWVQVIDGKPVQGFYDSELLIVD